MDRGTCCRGGVLPRRLPGVEREQTTPDDGGTWSSWHLTSEEQNLQEAHWRALATVAALEEEIERLSWPITRGQVDAHAHSRSWHCHRRRSRGQKRRCHQVQPEESNAPYFEYHPPWRGPESEEEEAAMDFDLEALLELGPEIDHFLQGPAESSGGGG